MKKGFSSQYSGEIHHPSILDPTSGFGFTLVDDKNDDIDQISDINKVEGGPCGSKSKRSCIRSYNRPDLMKDYSLSFKVVTVILTNKQKK